jgi:hypothetical protein
MSDVHRRDAELFAALSPTLGHDPTVMLLERLPPVGEELATRSDHLSLRHDLDTVKADVGALRSEANVRFDRLEERFDVRFETLRHEFNGNLHMELHRAISAQTRSLLIGLAGILLSCAGLAAAMAQLS